MLQGQKIKTAEALNDATKTLEFLPLDSIETTYKYFLLFKTREQAELVGEHALMVIKENDKEQAYSFVDKISDTTAHQILTHEDGFLVTIGFKPIKSMSKALFFTKQ